MPRRRASVAALLALALAAGCATTRTPPSPSLPAPERPTPGPPHLEERALLLLLVDRQIFEPYTVEQCLIGDAALRETLARALGNIPDARAARTLRGLLEDK